MANNAAAPTLAIYYAAQPDQVRGGDILTAAQVDWSDQADSAAQVQARAALELLLGGCGEKDFTSPMPRGTQIISCAVEGGTATVDFSAHYGQLSGMALTIADYCVTLTLTQIAGISRVQILVGGRELAYRDKNVFQAGDALLSRAEDVLRTFAVRLYFLDKQGELAGEERLLKLYEGQTRAAVVMDALSSGPEDSDLTALLPEDFAVLSLRTEDTLCYLNLSGADVELLPEDSRAQELLVQSMVRSLCSIDGISQVQILVDGEMQSRFGQVDISRPLSAGS